MSAIRGPRVVETRGNTLDSSLDTTGALQPSRRSIRISIPSELNPEQTPQLLLRLRIPSNKPATHCLLSQSHLPKYRYRGEV